jgi:predicted chitinase
MLLKVGSNGDDVKKLQEKLGLAADGDSVTTEVTKLVNGGTIGLDDRIAHFKKYYGLLK